MGCGPATGGLDNFGTQVVEELFFWRWRYCYQKLWYDQFSGWFLILIAQDFTTSLEATKNLPEYLVSWYLDMFFLPCKTHVASSFSHSEIVSWVCWNIHHQRLQTAKMEVLFLIGLFFWGVGIPKTLGCIHTAYMGFLYLHFRYLNIFGELNR